MPSICSRVFVSFAAAAFLLSPIATPPAAAQLQYGPWQKTSDCRRPKLPRGGPTIPQVPGVQPTMECKWERTVTDCPRVRDKLRHPIQCATKKQKSGYSVLAPR